MKNLFLILLIKQIISNIDIKNINENSQLKFSLKQNPYFTISIYIKDKEYNLPIDINSDRTWINNYQNNEENKNSILEECHIIDVDKKRKKNIPISFFDKSLILEEIAYEEINNNFDNNKCNTKNGVISLSKKSEKKILNLLTQLNKVYSLKKSFTIFNNELIMGNFDNEIKQKKYISAELLDSQYKWVFNLQGIYFGEINNNNFKDDYFVINILNNNYKKLNALFEFNSLQRYIIVYYFYFNFIKEKIFKNKCITRKNEIENFEGIYCDINTIEKLPNLGLMIEDKLLSIPIKKLFIKDNTSSNEYLFGIVFSEIVWDSCIIGSLFFNEIGNKVIFDAENNQIHFLSDQIIEKVKIVDDCSIDEKQILLNNYNFSKYDIILCIILILNFIGIFILLGSLYKEKIINQMPNHIKKMKRMNNN